MISIEPYGPSEFERSEQFDFISVFTTYGFSTFFFFTVVTTINTKFLCGRETPEGLKSNFLFTYGIGKKPIKHSSAAQPDLKRDSH